MKQVAVVLSGCGYLDGSEIQESVLTLLAVERHGGNYQCFAPQIQQSSVVDHLTNQAMPNETRQVLVEAARIARGDIRDIASANAEDFDAVIFPGGFGVATSISDFATEVENMQIHPAVTKFARNMYVANKQLGFICIAPSLIPKICGTGISCTIGNDKETAAKLEAMGASHVNCSVDDIVVDAKHKVYSTPAYMLGNSISQVNQGIDKLVAAILG
jgi:enhancing lycopene biosynthesis protein 2